MKARLEIALILSAALVAPAVGHAAWSVDPVTVHATTDACPLVAAASDAQDGAIVVWQQDVAASPGVFRLLARRVLANGDVDATWPAAGALVSSETVNRSALGALGDGNGGAYVWWMEGVELYLTRVLPDGTVATGWTARGRFLGYSFASAFHPRVFADGQGGIWLGWLMGAPLYTSGCIVHLGPDGLSAGGWPEGGFQYAISDQSNGGLRTLAFSYAPAPDGGVWVAWGDAVYDAAGYHAGSWRILRLMSEGSEAPGWESGSVAVREFHGELLVNASAAYPPYFAASPVAVASDGAEGAYLLVSDVVDGGATLTSRLFHRDSTGAAYPSWPMAGVVPDAGGVWRQAADYGADNSLRLFPEAAGGVFAFDITLTRFTPAATQMEWSAPMGGGFEFIVPPTGDTYLASYRSNIPFSQGSPFSGIALKHTYASGAAGPGFLEWNDHTLYYFYMDIGLAPTSGAGAIFVWSQTYERQGVFARRFAPDGEVVGVEPVAVAPRVFRLRFAPGRGVVATLGRVAEGRIQLHDVAGRVCAGTEVPAGAREVTIEGSAPLAPGLYFARHRGADGAIETGRVVIVR